MSEEQVQFYYFKLHDYDKNHRLDGIELMFALTHQQYAHKGGEIHFIINLNCRFSVSNGRFPFPIPQWHKIGIVSLNETIPQWTMLYTRSIFHPLNCRCKMVHVFQYQIYLSKFQEMPHSHTMLNLKKTYQPFQHRSITNSFSIYYIGYIYFQMTM